MSHNDRITPLKASHINTHMKQRIIEIVAIIDVTPIERQIPGRVDITAKNMHFQF